MRFIHTADWHLGRLFHGQHLTEDQAVVLDQLVGLAHEARPDVIVVAGDIYDRAVPPPEAVELLDDVLSRLVLDLRIPVILIAGNHDSPNRLNFGARLLAGRRLYVCGNLPRQPALATFHDTTGPVHFLSVPYAEPATVRQCLECPAVTDHNSAMAHYLDYARTNAITPNTRTILIAHAFVAGGSECESERPLSVGGAGTVDPACFAGFHYVALGHLHCRQPIPSTPGGYCGSLMKYSFDEADQPKGAFVVDMDAAGNCTQEFIPLKPRRDVRRITGRLADLLNGPTNASENRDDYLEVTLLDEGVVLDAIGRLREVYPNVLSLARAASSEGPDDPHARPDVRRMDDAQLFAAFYRHVRGADLTETQRQAFATVADDLLRRQREADAVASCNGNGKHAAPEDAAENVPVPLRV